MRNQNLTKVMQTFPKFFKGGVVFAAFLFLFSISAFAQDAKTITGTVTDNDGEPLIGVNVIIKGTQAGTVTDMDGKYSISASENSTLVFSYTGFKPQEIPVGDQSSIAVSLAEDTELLDEVVVVGYGVQKKSDLTGSVDVVEVDDAKKTITNDVAKMLQGQVANLTVQSSGEPGGFVDIKIRGITSFRNNNPLYVIDGMIVEDPYDFAPSDIESIQVLKDASASAIYGVRGANGVVIITTKKGQTGALKVNYNTRFGWQTIPKKISVTNREEYQQITSAAEVNAGLPVVPGNDPTSDQYISDVDTDWQDAAFKAGFLQQHTLNFSGGSEEVNYSLNLDYFDQSSYFDVPQAYDRISVDGNLNGKKGKFTYGTKMAYSISEKENFNEYNIGETSYGALLQAIPTMPVYDANRLGGYGGADNATQRAITLNVIGYNTLNENSSKRNRFAGNVWGQYEFIKGLKYKLRASGDVLNWTNRIFKPESDLGWYYITTPAEASLQLDKGLQTRTILDNLLTYDNTFGDHTIGALVGLVQERNETNNVYARGVGYSDGTIPQLEYAEEGQSVSQYNAMVTARSLVSRLNYSYGDRYLATFNFRQDKTSLFAEENNTGNYWSFSAAWKLHNEAWLSLPEQISKLKLRGGYGNLGNNTIETYNYLLAVNPFAFYPFGGSYGGGTTAIDIKDPDVKWEDTETTNFALELGLWNDKLTFSGEYFVKTSTDLLADVPIPLSTGAYPAVITTNAANVRNNGTEFSLTYKNLTNSGFSYSITANFGTLKNEVTSIGIYDNPIYGTGSKTAVGRSIGEIFVYETEGLFQSQEEIDNHAIQPNAAPGDVKFRDVNGDGVITDQDRTFQGNTIPKYNFGLAFNAEYKGFDAYVFFQGAGGHYIINNMYARLMLGDYTNHHTDMLDYWTPENTDTDVPRPVIGDPNANARLSDRFVEKGDYVRLQALEIGYTLPVLHKYVDHVRFAVSGQNLFVITKYKGADPDFRNNVGYDQTALFNRGFDNGSFPNPRGYFLSVQVGF